MGEEPFKHPLGVNNLLNMTNYVTCKEDGGGSGTLGAYEKTKDWPPPSATTAEKRETSKSTAPLGSREIPYATAI
jgi:hypothetical protein